MKKNTAFSPAVTDTMTDEELSQRLGRYQAYESLGMLIGVLCVIAGCVTAFIKHDIVLFSLLFFVGVGLILLIALPAQKKKKALMHRQLDGFFNAERLRFFGEEPSVPTLPIDRTYLQKAGLTVRPWRECNVNSFHEGSYDGLRFSAANVELRTSVEERSGPNNDNWMTREATVFQGVVIRCQWQGRDELSVLDRMEEPTETIADKPFFERFLVRTPDGKEADERVSPELEELCRNFEKAGAGRLCGLVLQNGTIAVALQTNYVFADIPNGFDMSDVAGMRRWYTATLSGMAELLAVLKNSPMAGKSETKA